MSLGVREFPSSRMNSLTSLTVRTFSFSKTLLLIASIASRSISGGLPLLCLVLRRICVITRPPSPTQPPRSRYRRGCTTSQWNGIRLERSRQHPTEWTPYLPIFFRHISRTHPTSHRTVCTCCLDSCWPSSMSAMDSPMVKGWYTMPR